MRIISMIIGFAILLVLLFGGALAALYFYQQRAVFAPSRQMVMTPAEVGMTFEDVWIELSSGERIHGWYFPANMATDKTVLFCHGNAGNISRRVYTAQFFVEQGVNFFIFDYRGYGRSDGAPSEENTYLDTKAAYDWLRKTRRVPEDQLFVIGRSLGGAVAVELATRVECAGLAVESSFTSALDMGRRMFPVLPVGLVIRYRYDNLKRISSVGCPILVAHSPEDDLIPYEMGQRLFEAASEPKTFVDLSGSHNDRDHYDDATYVETIRRFLALENRVSPPAGN